MVIDRASDAEMVGTLAFLAAVIVVYVAILGFAPVIDDAKWRARELRETYPPSHGGSSDRQKKTPPGETFSQALAELNQAAPTH